MLKEKKVRPLGEDSFIYSALSAGLPALVLRFELTTVVEAAAIIEGAAAGPALGAAVLAPVLKLLAVQAMVSSHCHYDINDTTHNLAAPLLLRLRRRTDAAPPAAAAVDRRRCRRCCEDCCWCQQDSSRCGRCGAAAAVVSVALPGPGGLPLSHIPHPGPDPAAAANHQRRS